MRGVVWEPVARSLLGSLARLERCKEAFADGFRLQAKRLDAQVVGKHLRTQVAYAGKDDQSRCVDGAECHYGRFRLLDCAARCGAWHSNVRWVLVRLYPEERARLGYGEQRCRVGRHCQFLHPFKCFER